VGGHGTVPEDLIGHIDPSSAKAVGSDVMRPAGLTRSTPRGRQAWRLIKGGTLGFSFRFAILKSSRRGDVRTLDEIDVFEISASPRR